MTRARGALGLVLTAAALAVATVLVPSTLATFSASKANSATASTQAVFPPLNSAAPGIAKTLGGAVTSLTAGLSVTATPGTWATNHPLETTYAYQWQRCSGGSCSDLAGATTPVYLVVAGDVGATLRVVVTATDANASVTPRNAMSAASVQVP